MMSPQIAWQSNRGTECSGAFWICCWYHFGCWLSLPAFCMDSADVVGIFSKVSASRLPHYLPPRMKFGGRDCIGLRTMPPPYFLGLWPSGQSPVAKGSLVDEICSWSLPSRDRRSVRRSLLFVPNKHGIRSASSASLCPLCVYNFALVQGPDCVHPPKSPEILDHCYG